MNFINSLTGKGIGVAVLDTGIYPHVDFDSRIIRFEDFLQNRRFPYDDNGHGTHVAGIIGGSGAGCQGKYRGVAPECDLIAMKVLDRHGNGKREVLLRAFRWILKYKDVYHIRIVNISVGTTGNNRKEQIQLIEGVEKLWDAGLIVVAAAGNRGPAPGSVTAPGNSRKVITVGSSDMMTGEKKTSGRGPTWECVCKPDIVAPGEQIMSCLPSVNKRPVYGRKSGTSMSTPYVSGSIAQMLQKDPNLNNVEIKMLLRQCAVDLGYEHNVQGWGMFDRARFLELLKL